MSRSVNSLRFVRMTPGSLRANTQDASKLLRKRKVSTINQFAREEQRFLFTTESIERSGINGELAMYRHFGSRQVQYN
jgi:hypothetical protein